MFLCAIIKLIIFIQSLLVSVGAPAPFPNIISDKYLFSTAVTTSSQVWIINRFYREKMRGSPFSCKIKDFEKMGGGGI